MAKHRIAVIGTGYVGLVSGACFAELGNNVVCIDIDEDIVNRLTNGVIPIYEPELEELVKKNIAEGRLSFTTDLVEVADYIEIIVLAVGTPPSFDGGADLSQIYSAVQKIAETIKGHKIVVTKSTVPVGTGDILKRIFNESKKNDAVMHYVSNPEFLREGSAINDFMKPDRVAIGADDKETLDVMEDLYKPLGCPIIRTDVKSAEMIKYASNAFLATKISFINEIANVCEEVGADIDVVAYGMGMDSRIGMSFLRAGIGYGGSCFPKDVQALKQLAGVTGYAFQLLNSVIEVNILQKSRILLKMKRKLGDLYHANIGIWGLSFKPDTDDMREASSLVLIKLLLNEGAYIKVYDPIAMNKCRDFFNNITYCNDPYEVARDADAIVLATEWKCFRELDYTKIKRLMRQPIIFDGRNDLDYAALRKLGFYYEGIGRR
ncbi:MAG: UDP-glucose/GDP-mannose dehydrogenase family protein [Actinobacteria bacterium]|nr:UDP-glucose/GDP-mannose dehydrogenase family protein [Actinomycetota bacterium]